MDNQKIEEIIEKYADDVLRICYVYTKDYNVSQDLFQEVFIKVYKNIDKFKGFSSEKTWIIRIAINTCKDYIKSAWIKRIVSFDIDNKDYVNTDEKVFENIKKQEILKAVLNLSGKFKEVIILYYYYGYDSKEISKILGISENAVRGRLSRARNELKKFISKEDMVYE